MDTVEGDRFVADCAKHIRANEARLSDAARTSPSLAAWANPVAWMGLGQTAAEPGTGKGKGPSAVSAMAQRPPMPLKLTSHHIYYLLIRFEGLHLSVGQLDVRIPSASRPSSYFAFVSSSAAGGGIRAKDTSDTMSLSSLRSTVSAFGSMSLGAASGTFFGAEKPNPVRDVKYIYSALTKIPALRIGPSPLKLIKDFEDCPGDKSVPLEVFKNVQVLEMEDVDPRTFLGWDRLSFQLRSLSIKRSGLEDVTDILVDAVLNDCKRRRGEKVQHRVRIVHSPNDNDVDEVETDPSSSASSSPSPRDEDQAAPPPLPSLSWHFLRHLCLAENSLTFVHMAPLHALESLTSLDLSNNLLNAVPPALSLLPNLRSLNVSNNLIDSVLGIPTALPAIEALNLSHNRLESLCGLERLSTLKRIDLRNNEVYDAGEVGRLATLEGVREVYVAQNPLQEEYDDARLEVFVEFAREGLVDVHDVKLDSEAPGYFERQRIAERVPRMRRHTREETPSAEEAREPEEQTSAQRQAADEEAETVNNKATVKAVKHRPQASHTHRVTSASASSASAAHAGPSRSRLDLAGQRQKGQLDGQQRDSSIDARRRNRRVVELNSNSNSSSIIPGGEGKVKDDGAAELSDSDAIKKAALQGDTNLALGWVPSSELTRGGSGSSNGGRPRSIVVGPAKASAMVGEGAQGSSLKKQEGGGDAEAKSGKEKATKRANAEAIKARRKDPVAAASASGEETGGGSGATKGSSVRTQANGGKNNNNNNDLRRRIEALKGEVGDDWLRLLSRGESVYVANEPAKEEEEDDPEQEGAGEENRKEVH